MNEHEASIFDPEGYAPRRAAFRLIPRGATGPGTQTRFTNPNVRANLDPRLIRRVQARNSRRTARRNGARSNG